MRTRPACDAGAKGITESLTALSNGYYSDWRGEVVSLPLDRWICGRHLGETSGVFGKRATLQLRRSLMPRAFLVAMSANLNAVGEIRR